MSLWEACSFEELQKLSFQTDSKNDADPPTIELVGDLTVLIQLAIRPLTAAENAATTSILLRSLTSSVKQGPGAKPLAFLPFPSSQSVLGGRSHHESAGEEGVGFFGEDDHVALDGADAGDVLGGEFHGAEFVAGHDEAP